MYIYLQTLRIHLYVLIYNQLKNVYIEICSIYRSLYKIECSGRKDSSLFKTRVSELKKVISKEKKMLEQLACSEDYDLVKEEIFLNDSQDEFYHRMRDYFIIHETNVMLIPHRLIFRRYKVYNKCVLVW